jgi:hypothetical protein
VRTANQPESTGFESWRDFKRRNDTGSSRIPSPLAHHARPVRQYRTDATLSRLLSPSPPIHGSGCLQLHPAATTARRWTVSHLHMDISASWRTGTSRRPGSRALAPAETGARSDRLGGVRGRCRRGAGWSSRWKRRFGSRGRRVRRGCGVAPGEVLGGQADDQGRRPAGMAGRPSRVGWVVQRRAISWRCQRRMVAGVTSSPRRRRRASSRMRAAISARSVQVTRGRGVRR